MKYEEWQTHAGDSLRSGDLDISHGISPRIQCSACPAERYPTADPHTHGSRWVRWPSTPQNYGVSWRRSGRLMPEGSFWAHAVSKSERERQREMRDKKKMMFGKMYRCASKMSVEKWVCMMISAFCGLSKRKKLKTATFGMISKEQTENKHVAFGQHASCMYLL